MSRSGAPAWQAFVVAAILLAIAAGFGLGGYLMVMTALFAYNVVVGRLPEARSARRRA